MNTGMSSCSQVIITTEVRRFPPARRPQKIYLYNNSTSAWDLEHTYNAQYYRTPSAPYRHQCGNYMSSGTVKVRVFVGGTGTAYLHALDGLCEYQLHAVAPSA